MNSPVENSRECELKLIVLFHYFDYNGFRIFYTYVTTCDERRRDGTMWTTWTIRCTYQQIETETIEFITVHDRYGNTAIFCSLTNINTFNSVYCVHIYCAVRFHNVLLRYRLTPAPYVIRHTIDFRDEKGKKRILRYSSVVERLFVERNYYYKL